MRFVNILIVGLTLATSQFVEPNLVHAQAWEDRGEGRCVYDGDVATIGGIECIVEIALEYLIGFVAIGILVMLVFGGYKFLTSGGDPKNVEAGKNIITYAVVGLVIALLSVFILVFIANFTGAMDILNFRVGSQSTTD